MHRKPWIEADKAFVKDNFLKMNCQEMGERLGRTTKAVQHLFNELGLYDIKQQQLKIGEEFNQLKVIGLSKKKYGPKWYTTAICLCDCGNPEPREILQKDIRSGLIVSCRQCAKKRKSDATSKRNRTHGGSRSRLYKTWSMMKSRCYNPKSEKYKYYGGKGVKLCDEWLNSFEAFRDWAMANGYQESLTIERKQNDGIYEPSNCEWITAAQQKLNMTSNINLTAFGETKPVSEWARDKRCLVCANTIYQRVEHGWEDEEAITKPSQQTKTRRPPKETAG